MEHSAGNSSNDARRARLPQVASLEMRTAAAAIVLQRPVLVELLTSSAVVAGTNISGTGSSVNSKATAGGSKN